MDPNANLQEQERILERARELYAANKSGDTDAIELAKYHAQGDKATMRELRSAHREWLSNGGFAPDWDTCPRAAKYYLTTRGTVRKA
jgi:DNA-binding SARP family transcriptional activator